MAFSPHRFGRYTIVDPIAVGGMAEIYRARLTNNTEGTDRIIVIKKVIANLSKNEEFVQMFEEEIKITVGLTHPNIIQIYDYGQEEDQYFMAMEYVEGKNLRQFVKRLADMKSMFSIDMSCHIISQTCQALAYAHSFKDRLSGKCLGIVHRDISPQNIMISYDGAVKLFDFGIAKAKSANESTKAGVIKGKPSYLSPEQINGDVLDGRSDIFALGIVVWELLTAKRLFVSDTDMGVLRMIQSAKIEPPSTFNPAVPQQLDAIVLKALSRDKTKRYQTAEEFQRDLHKFLYAYNPSFNPADLSYYAQELFKTEIKDDRARLMKYLAMPVTGEAVGGKDKKLSTKLADGLVTSTDFNREAMENIVSGNTGATLGDKANKTSEVEIEATDVSGITSVPTPGQRSPGVPPNVGITVDRAKLAASAPGSRSGKNMVIPPWTKQSIGSSSGVKGTRSAIELQTALRQSGSKSSSFALAGVFVVLLLGGYYFDLFRNTPLDFIYGDVKPQQTAATNVIPDTRPKAVTPPEVHTPINRTPAQLQMGTIILRSNVDGYSVTVNGNLVSVVNDQFTVPSDQELVVMVSKTGYQSASFRTTVSSSKTVSFAVELKALPTGVLFFNTTPSAKLTFYGQNGSSFVLNSPVKNQRVPVGVYKVIIENSLLGHRSEASINIEAEKLTRVEKTLH